MRRAKTFFKCALGQHGGVRASGVVRIGREGTAGDRPAADDVQPHLETSEPVVQTAMLVTHSEAVGGDRGLIAR